MGGISRVCRITLLMLALGLLTAPAAKAAIFVVNDTDDVADAAIGDGICDAAGADTCTLRAAIQEANFTVAQDSVEVQPGTYSLSISGTDDTAAAGDLDITNDLQINGVNGGNNAANHIVEVNRTLMDPDDRVFDIWNAGTSVGLQYLTIRQGNPAGRGGGVRANRATVAHVTNTVVTSNTAQVGGGVFGDGADLRLTATTVRANTVSNPGFNSLGGGVALQPSFSPTQLDGDATIALSKVDGNTAPQGGAGLYLIGGSPTVTRTIIVNNQVTAGGFGGGGVYVGSEAGTDALIDESVVAGNTATIGAGVRNAGDSTAPKPKLILRNSTVANNLGLSNDNGITYPAAVFNTGELIVESTTISDAQRALGNDQSGQGPGEVALFASILANGARDDCASGEPGPFPGGGITSLGYNVIEDPGNLCAPHATDVTGQDPQLGDLGDNGGFSETMELGPSSPALDLVPADLCPPPATDQRLVPRPLDGPDADLTAECDSGAYEAIPFTIDDPTVIEGDSGTSNMTFTVSRPAGWGTATVNYATASGTATASDYGAVSGTLTFQHTETEQTVVVPVVGDTAYEGGGETVLLNLSSPTRGVIADGQGTGTITDNDPEPDSDGDSHLDSSDNCPDSANADQANADGDAFGDACDSDRDGDSFPNASDSCPDTSGTAGGCPDGDTDGVADASDNCPDSANADQANADGDAFGDACDPDRDGDGFNNPSDSCPAAVGTAQGCPDGDGDGVRDTADNCAATVNPDQADLDRDGAGDACDPPPRCRGATATVLGTGGADTIRGTRRRDVIVALGGRDVIKGLRGNDTICGGRGRDRILGGPGRDMLFGQQGADILVGGPGRDTLRGGLGRDRQRP